jgi:formate dehydrogenase maturation protein FdhE
MQARHQRLLNLPGKPVRTESPPENEKRMGRANPTGHRTHFDLLRFYAQVAMLQQNLSIQFERVQDRFFSADATFRDQLNISILLPKLPDFLKSLAKIAPPPLAQAAHGLMDKNSASWSRLIEDFWQSPDPMNSNYASDETLMSERCLAWLFLQPYAEHLAARQERTFPDETPLRCPLCGSKPIVAVLRPEGDGAKKALICILCANEWGFRRTNCPSCSEKERRTSHFIPARRFRTFALKSVPMRVLVDTFVQ